MNVFELTPKQLDQEAREIAARSEKNDWLRLASIIGRIDDEGLWPHLKYGSTLGYATHELDIDVERFMVLMNLWRMVKETLPGSGIELSLSLDEWSGLRITYALELQRLHNALKSRPVRERAKKIHQWFEIALAAESAEDLRRQIDVDLNKQPFVRWSVSVPPEVATLADEAIVKALRAGGAADPEGSAKNRRGRHIGFEVVVRTFEGALPESLECAIEQALPSLVGDHDNPRAAALDLIGRFFTEHKAGR